MLGALAAGSLGRLAAYLVVVSVGTLLTAFALGTAGIAAGLYYLPHGTFASALLFLLAEAVRRRRAASADFFKPDADMPRKALWGGLYFVAAIAAAGLPPLSGFIGKFLILRAAPDRPWVWAVILVAALAGVIALARAGSRLFFNARAATAPPPDGAPEAHSAWRELIACGGLLGLILALTLGAGPAFDFAQATALQLADPAAYIAAVLGSRP
jgi:multicomponent K+:H+ antiporter subunit D